MMSNLMFEGEVEGGEIEGVEGMDEDKVVKEEDK